MASFILFFFCVSVSVFWFQLLLLEASLLSVLPFRSVQFHLHGYDRTQQPQRQTGISLSLSLILFYFLLSSISAHNNLNSHTFNFLKKFWCIEFQVLLGDMGAGKSSLVLRFVKGQFLEFQVIFPSFWFLCLIGWCLWNHALSRLESSYFMLFKLENWLCFVPLLFLFFCY